MTLRALRPLGLLSLTAALASSPSLLVPQQVAKEGTIDAPGNARLYYRVVGSGRDTIVALHGGPGFHLGYLVPDLEPLARSRTVIYYDQRGAGRSTVVTDSARLTIAAHVSDLEAVRRHFKLDRMVLFGHAWGAGLATRYTLAYPDRVAKLVLVNALPPRRAPYIDRSSQNLRLWTDTTIRAQLAMLSAARDTAKDAAGACRAYFRVFIRGYFFNPQDTIAPKKMRGDVCAASPEALRNTARVNRFTIASLGAWDWRTEFRETRAPVLIIHGAKDPIPLESAREWQSAFPSAKLVIVPNAGHFPHVEQPAAFFRAIDEFLPRR